MTLFWGILLFLFASVITTTCVCYIFAGAKVIESEASPDHIESDSELWAELKD